MLLNIFSVRASRFCLCALFISLSLLAFDPSVVAVVLRRGNETDREALIDIKSKITNDPFHVLSSWNDSIHFCHWHGVRCGRRHQRVAVLDLINKGLGGSLAPSIGNLSFLVRLYLTGNSFSQAIPPEISHMKRLRYLWLANNSFTGEIPPNISACSNLHSIDLSNNKLEGSIPSDFGSWLRAEDIFLGNNKLSSRIPESIGNLSSLVRYSVGYNHLKGSIPASLGQLKKLKIIDLFSNNLSGKIPPTIYNLSSLVSLDVSVNQLQGSLPGSIGYSLPRLSFLGMAKNHFTGELPTSLSNMSTLKYLFLNSNGFTGQLPSLRHLKLLVAFTITDNLLGSGKATDLRFIYDMGNATNLRTLAINDNQFGGVLPISLGNLSTSLSYLYLGGNQISGTVPEEIENLMNLQALRLNDNIFIGRIPAGIGRLKNLKILDMANNGFIGGIPSCLGNLSMLTGLYLRGNNFQGIIPRTLGDCLDLLSLDLSENKLSGNIPSQVMRIPSLSIYISFASNLLTGTIPAELGSLKNLGALDVSGNMLSGEIPSYISQCESLEELSLNGNSFQGKIPAAFSSLHGIQYLDLSQNNLSGEIPKYFENFNLQYLNLSFNNFSGSLPEKGIFKNVNDVSVVGNPNLCGGVADLHLPRCQFVYSTKHSHIKLVISSVLGLLGLGSVLGVLVIIFRFRKVKKDHPLEPMGNQLLNVSYRTLLQATDGFSEANFLGAGAYGSVYKGTLGRDGTIVAVKVLNLLHRGASKSFKSECEALRNIRHRNLVKVLSACSGVDYKGSDFKALVYEFMAKSSLGEWLHPITREMATNVERERRCLDFRQRVNIAIDVANGLDYLHNHCETPIVHCDLKPDNVLLDDEFVAHVGDFGLAGLLLPISQYPQTTITSSRGVRGSIGYTAPEYGIGSELSASGDVYSFGVLLLEMFTGKRPTDEMFEGDFSLHKFVEDALPNHVIDIADPMLFLETVEEGTSTRRPERHFTQTEAFPNCLISLFEIGLHCTAESASDRIFTSNIVRELHLVRNSLLKAGKRRTQRVI